jgi:flagellar biosynthesis chaperone FliJ
MTKEELAALERLRQLRLDRAASELATVRDEVSLARKQLDDAEAVKRNASATVLARQHALSSLHPTGISQILDARLLVEVALTGEQDAGAVVESCQARRTELLHLQDARRATWRKRHNAVEQWHYLQQGFAEAADQDSQRREDSEDLNRSQTMLTTIQS